jgi:hypothetical protein
MKNNNKETAARIVQERMLSQKPKNIPFAEIWRVILGIGQLLVVVSIIYSTAIVMIGVNSAESKILLVPQAVFALAILVKAFSKLNK